MKRILLLALLLTVLVLTLISCGESFVTTDDVTTTEDVASDTTTAEITTEEKTLTLVNEGKTDYVVIVADGLYTDTEFRSYFEQYAYRLSRDITIRSDKSEKGEYEILIGNTNREASMADDALYKSHIRLREKTLVFTGENPDVLLGAFAWFCETYVNEGSVVLPLTIEKSFSLDMSTSIDNNKTFAAIADEVYDSFNTKYFKHGWVQGNAYWDKAEMLETYIDAYEATRSDKTKEKMQSFADMFIKLYRTNWSSNEYNDDIMWACIAFARMAKLLGNETYIEYAKTNFDIVWERAYDDTLDGGLYWRIENETKNSCVNCPGAIAACLIAELTEDRGYYEKAKLLMDWEFKYMFETGTGRVYDAYSVSGNINKWASTYNQGTFIGACTLLHQAFGDQKYLDYAAKAAEYAMTKLVNRNSIIDNGEASLSNRDLPGFKGILVRWLYRYAKYTDDLDILAFLQMNASYAYQMKNAEGLIWTDWAHTTPPQTQIDRNGNYVVFGMSTAVALMYNCQQWWD